MGGGSHLACKHPNLTLQAPAPLSRAQVSTTDLKVASHYFYLLAQTMADNDLLDKSCKIFNMDEPGMPLDPKQVKRVFECGVENMLAPSSGDKTEITVVACTWCFR